MTFTGVYQDNTGHWRACWKHANGVIHEPIRIDKHSSRLEAEAAGILQVPFTGPVQVFRVNGKIKAVRVAR